MSQGTVERGNAQWKEPRKWKESSNKKHRKATRKEPRGKEKEKEKESMAKGRWKGTRNHKQWNVNIMKKIPYESWNNGLFHCLLLSSFDRSRSGFWQKSQGTRSFSKNFFVQQTILRFWNDWKKVLIFFGLL